MNIELADINLCTGCGACASACKINAIKMKESEEGFYVPIIDYATCSSCGNCRKACPVLYPQTPAPIQESLVYAGWANNKHDRMNGSSGGAFGVLADWVIAKGGVVFGAIFQDDYKSVAHSNTDAVALEKIKKSKYVESYMGLTCRKVEECLKENRWVLFCGTPCQVMGVRKYLGIDYEKLILCDFLCHGVPSNRVLNKYLVAVEKKMKKSISKVDFRSKDLGWKTYCMKIIFEDGSKYLKLGTEDPYYRLFFKNVGLRQCCYTCDKAVNSMADITIGDFWGVRKYTNIPDTDEGISIFCIHTAMGEMAFESIKNQIIASKIAFDEIAYAYKKKPIKNNNRKEFFDRLNNDSFDFWGNHILPKLTIKVKIKAVLMRNSFCRTSVYKVFANRKRQEKQ